jgi:adenylate kinase
VYTPSSTLPDPTPEPGYVYRWIATHIMGQADPTNVSRKMRDGWVPVKAVDHPELMLEANEKTGNVEIGGLMLCKQPSEQAKARDEYFNKQAQDQMDSVDNHFMRNNDPRMPLFSDRKSTVSRGAGFGSGSK